MPRLRLPRELRRPCRGEISLIALMLAIGFTVAATTFIINEGRALRDSLRSVGAVQTVHAQVRAVQRQYQNASGYQVDPPLKPDLTALGDACEKSVASSPVPANLVSCRLGAGVTSVAFPGTDAAGYKKWFAKTGDVLSEPCADDTAKVVGTGFRCATESGGGDDDKYFLIPDSLATDVSGTRMLASDYTPTENSGIDAPEFGDSHTFPFAVNAHRRFSAANTSSLRDGIVFRRICVSLITRPPAGTVHIGMFRGFTAVTRHPFGVDLETPINFAKATTDSTLFDGDADDSPFTRAEWVVPVADAVDRYESAGGCQLGDVLILFIR